MLAVALKLFRWAICLPCKENATCVDFNKNNYATR